MHAPIDEFFSLVPELAFEQALTHVVATYPTPEGEKTLLLLARYARFSAPQGAPCDGERNTVGIEVVAYPCDAAGTVLNWEARYQVQGVSCEAAMDKLRFSLANGLLCLWNYEGILAEIEAVRAGAWGIDWDQMPEGL